MRLRPQLAHEAERGWKDIARVVDGKMVVLMDPHDNSGDILRKNRSREKQFAFDTCFAPESQQQEVYAMTTKPIIKGVLNGYNATVFAYGPTGSGKTYTMLGNQENPGIMTHTMRDLFKLIHRRSEDTEFEVTMTYVELYNEYLYDLLVHDSDELELREDGQGTNHIVGAKEVLITNPDQVSCLIFPSVYVCVCVCVCVCVSVRLSVCVCVHACVCVCAVHSLTYKLLCSCVYVPRFVCLHQVLGLLLEGNQRRTQEATAANATSSRSHAILCIRVRSSPRAKDISHSRRVSACCAFGSKSKKEMRTGGFCELA